MFYPTIIEEGGVRRLSPAGRAAVANDFPLRSEVPLDSKPGWVVGTTATFRSPVFNRESPALLAFRTKVAAALAGRSTCRLTVTGDSKAANFQGLVLSWPEQLRRQLAASDGFIEADDGVMDPRWAVTGMQVSAVSSLGLRPTTTGTTDPKQATFTGTEPFTGGAVKVRITGGGTATLTIDGTAQQVTVPTVAGWHLLDLGALPDVPHTIRIEATGDLSVAGITPTYASPRLLISNPSQPSAAAADWSTTSPTGRWETLLADTATPPDVIISALGTNEITNLTAVTAYYDKLATLGVPVIIISPGGIDNNRGLTETHALAAHLYQIAQQHDWPLIDEEQVIGLYAQANAHQLMLDTLHGNTRASALLAMVVVALIAGAIA